MLELFGALIGAAFLYRALRRLRAQRRSGTLPPRSAPRPPAASLPDVAPPSPSSPRVRRRAFEQARREAFELAEREAFELAEREAFELAEREASELNQREGSELNQREGSQQVQRRAVSPAIAVGGNVGSVPSPDVGVVPSPGRYANVIVTSASGGHPARVELDRQLRLEVSIGQLDQDSDVVDPVPFPDRLLPDDDVTITVLLTSTELEVRFGDDGAWSTAVEATLVLPSGGGPGDRPLHFGLRLPENPKRSRARLSYMYRNTIVQSQRVALVTHLWHSDNDVVDVWVATDFTLSQSLGPDLGAIRERPRLTIVANHAPGNDHQVAVRAGGPCGQALQDPVSYVIGDQRLGPAVDALRKRLDANSPQVRRRRRAELIQDLRQLAPLGYDLYTALSGPIQDGVQTLAGAGDAVVQVVLPRDSGFTLPWSFVYDIFLDSAIDVEKVPVCRLVGDWDGERPLVEVGARCCPHDDGQNHLEALLCPFGFWGLRYSFELLTSTDRPKVAVAFPKVSRVVVAETAQINSRKLNAHIARFGEILAVGVRGAELHRVTDRTALRDAIEADLPLLYFLCHGDRDGDRTSLSIGRSDRVTAGDLEGWMTVARRARHRRMWTDPQPLVFINACGSLAITPHDLTDYVTTLIGKGGAAGLIGTEVRVEQTQAMALAETFFAAFLTPGATIDHALRTARTSFLADGNILGLFYTAYCFADLTATLT